MYWSSCGYFFIGLLLPSIILAKCPTHLNLLDLIIMTTLSVTYKLWILGGRYNAGNNCKGKEKRRAPYAAYIHQHHQESYRLDGLHHHHKLWTGSIFVQFSLLPTFSSWAQVFASVSCSQIWNSSSLKYNKNNELLWRYNKWFSKIEQVYFWKPKSNQDIMLNSTPSISCWRVLYTHSNFNSGNRLNSYKCNQCWIKPVNSKFKRQIYANILTF